MTVDHVIYAVKDASVTAAALRRTYGLGAVEGAFHPGLGTHNWVVPLQWPQYLEILEVVDEEAAAKSTVGRLIAARVAQGDGLLTWAVRADDMDAVAARVGVEPWEQQASDAKGKTMTTWRVIFGGPELPFFIAYASDPAEQREFFEKRRTAAQHDCQPCHFSWIEHGGDKNRLRAWLDDETLPVGYAGSAPGLRSVAIATAHGEIVLQ
jgi:Glyoxalase-like domain